MKYFLPVLVGLVTVNATANTSDPNVHYLVAGKGVAPWELSLQFGEVLLDNQSGQTVRASLVAEPANRNGESDAIRFTWSPKGVKNEWGTDDTSVQTITLINRAAPVNISSVVDQAALTVDLRVINRPSRPVTITLESAWDWRTWSGVPLRSALRGVPRNEWISIPVPLRCFLGDNEAFDLSQITGIQLQTGGRMELEISDIRLTAYPAEQSDCG